MTAVLMRDEEMTGKSLCEFSIDILTETITVRELLRSRVHQQIKDHNMRRLGAFQGIIERGETEAALNADRLRKKTVMDWKPYFERAAEAYQRNQILVLVGDRQTESLEEQVQIQPGTEIVFMRLTPLVGG
ncbi:MAG: hypothetical protein NXI04_03325 [Planctomycetaceae bacterium]|nr:hypothetical protein [Planctomycetaceae bacterium]